MVSAEYKPRPLRLVRLAVYGMLFTLLVMMMGAIGIWFAGKSEVNEQLALLRHQGQPTTAREVNDFYRVPEGVPDATLLWLNATDALEAARLSERAGDLPFIGSGLDTIPPPGTPWEQLEASRELIDSLQKELQLIRAAAAVGGAARFPVDFSLGISADLTSTQRLRDVARLLSLSAHVNAHDGDYAQAAADIQAVFTVSDALQAEPMLISQLVRIAIHAVGCSWIQELILNSDVTDEELAALQQAVAAADFQSELLRAFSGERAVMLSSLGLLPLGPFHQANANAVLRFTGSTMESIGNSWTEALESGQLLQAELQQIGSGSFSRMSMMGVRMHFPSVEQAVVAGVRGEARRRTALTALAAKRALRRHGEFPAGIDAFPPDVFPFDGFQQPLDPFNDQPLKYLINDSELRIYSVGENQQDDGGQLDPVARQGPLDIGFVLPK